MSFCEALVADLSKLAILIAGLHQSPVKDYESLLFFVPLKLWLPVRPACCGVLAPVVGLASRQRGPYPKVLACCQRLLCVLVIGGAALYFGYREYQGTSSRKREEDVPSR